MTPEKKSTQSHSDADSIGRRFQSARETKGLSHADISAATHMMEKHIRAIESDDFSALGAAVYARGFIKLYADFLGLDTSAVLNDFGKKVRKKNDAPALLPPQPRSELKAEITEAVQQRVEQVVSAARTIPSRIPGKIIKKILLNAVFALVLVLLITACIFGIKSCAASLKDNQPAQHRNAHHSNVVIEDPPEPYLDAP